MKNLLFLTIFLLACKTPKPAIPAQLEITPAEIQIAKNLIQGAFDDLWAGVDSTKILDYHTADFIILEQGKIWDNDRIKVFMREQLAEQDRPVRVNIMDYISIEKHGQAINIAYYNHADFYRSDTIATTANWLESALAIPTENGWRLKMMHSTWAGREAIIRN